MPFSERIARDAAICKSVKAANGIYSKMREKSDNQWCEDNGVPPTASWHTLNSGMDVIKVCRAQLKRHNLTIRTKSRRGQYGSYIWVEPDKKDNGK